MTPLTKVFYVKVTSQDEIESFLRPTTYDTESIQEQTQAQIMLPKTKLEPGG